MSSPPAPDLSPSMHTKINRCDECQIRHWPTSACPPLCTSSASDCCFQKNTDFGAPCDTCTKILPKEKKNPFLSAKDYDYPSDPKDSTSEDSLPIASTIYIFPLIDLLTPLFLGLKRCLKCSVRHHQDRACPTLCTSSALYCVFRADSDFGLPCTDCCKNLPSSGYEYLSLSKENYDFPHGRGGTSSFTIHNSYLIFLISQLPSFGAPIVSSFISHPSVLPFVLRKNLAPMCLIRYSVFHAINAL